MKRFCPSCGDPIDLSKYRDLISIKEFLISGLCPKCQDKVFISKATKQDESSH